MDLLSWIEIEQHSDDHFEATVMLGANRIASASGSTAEDAKQAAIDLLRQAVQKHLTGPVKQPLRRLPTSAQRRALHTIWDRGVKTQTYDEWYAQRVYADEQYTWVLGHPMLRLSPDGSVLVMDGVNFDLAFDFLGNSRENLASVTIPMPQRSTQSPLGFELRTVQICDMETGELESDGFILRLHRDHAPIARIIVERAVGTDAVSVHVVDDRLISVMKTLLDPPT